MPEAILGYAIGRNLAYGKPITRDGRCGRDEQPDNDVLPKSQDTVTMNAKICLVRPLK